MDVGVTYLIYVLSKFKSLHAQRYTNLWVDVGVTYLIVSFQFQKSCNTKIHKSVWVDVGVTYLIVSFQFKSLQYKDTQICGWTLALHTSSVLSKFTKVYNTKNYRNSVGGRWRYIRLVSFKM